MFGPDLCGYDVSRIHLIFSDHLDTNHERDPEIKMDFEDKDEYTHLYTLILRPDQTYTVLFDNKKKAAWLPLGTLGFREKDTRRPDRHKTVGLGGR